MKAALVTKRSIHCVWRAPRQKAQPIPAPSNLSLHEELGIETQVYRMPVLGHFQHAGVSKRDRYDPVTETWSADHLFRASVTLAKV